MHGASGEFKDGNHFVTAHDRVRLYESHPHRITGIGSVVLHKLHDVLHHEQTMQPPTLELQVAPPTRLM